MLTCTFPVPACLLNVLDEGAGIRDAAIRPRTKTRVPMTHAGDVIALHELVAAYSHAISCRDSAAPARVFAEDGVLHAFADPPVEGRAAIEANRYCPSRS